MASSPVILFPDKIQPWTGDAPLYLRGDSISTYTSKAVYTIVVLYRGLLLGLLSLETAAILETFVNRGVNNQPPYEGLRNTTISIVRGCCSERTNMVGQLATRGKKSHMN